MDDSPSLPRVLVDPPLTPELRTSIAKLWREVSLSGGAVGFNPDSSPETIERFAAAELEAVTSGQDHLVIHQHHDAVVAMAILKSNSLEIMSHWIELKRFMVHPSRQRTGFGRQFSEAIAVLARDQLGLEQLFLTARSGLGTEAFWTKCGYQHVATLAKRVKLGAGDYRDVYCMTRDL